MDSHLFTEIYHQKGKYSIEFIIFKAFIFTLSRECAVLLFKRYHVEVKRFSFNLDLSCECLTSRKLFHFLSSASFCEVVIVVVPNMWDCCCI